MSYKDISPSATDTEAPEALVSTSKQKSLPGLSGLRLRPRTHLCTPLPPALYPFCSGSMLQVCEPFEVYTQLVSIQAPPVGLVSSLCPVAFCKARWCSHGAPEENNPFLKDQVTQEINRFYLPLNQSGTVSLEMDIQSDLSSVPTDLLEPTS